MKLEFQAKFLQHLNKKKKQEEGFTLIELLVVIIIIGILAAIALPSLLSQVNKGKQAEAKQNVGALSRAQQAYLLESDQFATSIGAVGIGIKTQTVNYFYTIKPDDPTAAGAVNNIGAGNQQNQDFAKEAKTLRSYVSQNFTAEGDVETSEVLSLGFVCESLALGQEGSQAALDAAPVTDTTVTSCPAGFKDLGSATKK